MFLGENEEEIQTEIAPLDDSAIDLDELGMFSNGKTSNYILMFEDKGYM